MMDAQKPDAGSAPEDQSHAEDKAEAEFLLLQMLLERKRIREARASGGSAGHAESRLPEETT